MTIPVVSPPTFEHRDGLGIVEATVPPNTTATVVLGGITEMVGSGTHRWEYPLTRR